MIKTIAVGDGSLAFTWNLVQNRTYVANYNSSSVSVLRDSLTGIAESKEKNILSTWLGATIFSGNIQLPKGKS